jgi:hypothetical protein
MKISLVTTWNSVCGVAEYSKSLVDALNKLGHEITILGSTIFPLLKDDELFVSRLGLPGEVDILHIQYEAYIFGPEYINLILREAELKGIKCFATFHDSCFAAGPDWHKLNGAIAHREEILKTLPVQNKYIIPSGVTTTPVRIASFGLGRNNNMAIQQCCNELGFELRVSDWHDWKTQEELLEFIKSCDATILWYPEEKFAGSSSCARLAIGARRLLYVNNVKWFEELDNIDDVYVFNNAEELKEVLKEHFYTLYRKI